VRNQRCFPTRATQLLRCFTFSDKTAFYRYAPSTAYFYLRRGRSIHVRR
jgi:hypothetical protein